MEINYVSLNKAVILSNGKLISINTNINIKELKII
jgi:hypothetical protein